MNNIKTAEEVLMLCSIFYWKHEYYEKATNEKLGDFKDIILNAMELYKNQDEEDEAIVKRNPFLCEIK